MRFSSLFFQENKHYNIPSPAVKQENPNFFYQDIKF